MYKVSIVVPFYNVETYFRAFLNSLLPINDSFEVLLVDDGSLDSSLAIAEEFLMKYENVRLIRKSNGGLSSARNVGLSDSSGEYIIFFDSDDYIENKDVILEMYEKAVFEEADITVAPYYEFAELNDKKYRYDKVNIDRPLVALEDKLDSFFSNSMSFAVWNKLFKRSLLKENDLQFKDGIWFEDLEFVFRTFYFANKVTRVDNVLIGYRQRSGSIMKSVSSKILDKVKVMDDLCLFLSNKEQLGRFYEGFKILYLRMAFSVIYSTVINGNGQQKECRLIMKELFSSLLFKKFLKEKLKSKVFFSNFEKFFYFLLKYRVVNERNVFLLRLFN